MPEEKPGVAVAPQSVPWVEQAIRDAGAAVVPAREADGLVWMSARRPEELGAVLGGAPSVRWVQLPLAGIEAFVEAGLLADGRTWTCAKGIYADPVAEHALGLAVAGLRDVVRSVRATSWGPPSGRVLTGGRVTIVGGGGITRSLIRLLGPFGTVNTVVRQRPEPVEGAHRTLAPDGLLEALADADAVVLALALTPANVGLIGAEELAAMPSHAWLVNVARGRHVRTEDLVEALTKGTIGGAALDVTDPEPLPEGHPLWSLPNCVITPHIANTPEMSVGPLIRLVRDNVGRFVRGEPLTGLVDPGLGY
ncbi:MAG TPA: D-isomer specific 2-hydroxyacid dehydrogenase family protein [Acidimicrobiales bacterium]|nr:D-isomer specific 2-hydroxyacid dehydrogenase family protein [Acidimicrobiales bacterium]